MTAAAEAQAIVEVLGAARLTYRDEVSLHEAMADVLDDVGVHHRREVTLAPSDRIDFLTDRGVGIEVKVAGSLAAVVRQMLRYAHHPAVQALVLVTTVARHGGVPKQLAGVPVHLCSLIGQGL